MSENRTELGKHQKMKSGKIVKKPNLTSGDGTGSLGQKGRKVSAPKNDIKSKVKGK